jgi:hypothetical protein
MEVGQPHLHRDEIAALLSQGTFDRVIGSLHCLWDGEAYAEPWELFGHRPAVEVFRASQLARLHAIIDRTFVIDRPKGSGVFSTSDHALKLTDDEAQELRQEIDDLIDSWADRTRGRDPERRTYTLLQVVQPYPDGDDPD